MKHLTITLAFLMTLSTQAVSDTISVIDPSAVTDAINVYRADCAENGGKLELDGDEVSKLCTDEGEEAYVIRAAFTCGDFGHIWCGAMGHCPIGIIVSNTFYDTNRILTQSPNRISSKPDGSVTYWLPDGLQLVIER